MKTNLLLLTTIVLVFVCQSFAQSDLKLQIGARLPAKYVPKNLNQYVMTHPSQTRPFIRTSVRKVNYLIAFDAKTFKIRYIQTFDKKFQTVNGLRVGSEIEVTREQLNIYPGWYILGPETPDGWHPILGADLPLQGQEKFDNLKPGQSVKVTIESFSKGGN